MSLNVVAKTPDEIRKGDKIFLGYPYRDRFTSVVAFDGPHSQIDLERGDHWTQERFTFILDMKRYVGPRRSGFLGKNREEGHWEPEHIYVDPQGYLLVLE